MGHTFTPKFELQIEKPLEFKEKVNSVIIQGVNSIKDAEKEILWYLNNWQPKITGKFYLWGNSQSGKSYLEKQNADYYCYFMQDGKLHRETCGTEIVY